MRKCKDCKFWAEDKLLYKDFGDCLCDKFAYEENIKTEEENKYHVLYGDDEGYLATLKVNKDFGCIDFEEKER